MSKKITPITHEEWLKELFPANTANRPKGSFTVSEVVKATGMNERTVRTRINIKISKGEITFVTGICNGKKTNFYTEIKKK